MSTLSTVVESTNTDRDTSNPGTGTGESVPNFGVRSTWAHLFQPQTADQGTQTSEPSSNNDNTISIDVRPRSNST